MDCADDDALLSIVRQRLAPSDAALDVTAATSTTDADRCYGSAVRREYADGEACSSLVVAFSSLGGGAGGVAHHEFVRSCAQAGISHSFYVTDAKQSWMLLGLTDGGGGFADVVAAVAAEAHALRPSRLTLVGASMGGYAALRAALALRHCFPDVVVLAFAPQVFLDPEERGALAAAHAL